MPPCFIYYTIIYNESMKLVSFRIKNYRSIFDSKVVNLSDIERGPIVSKKGNCSNPQKIKREHVKYPIINLAKGEIDTRRGEPVIVGQGGPDNFGYTWIDSDETGGPIFNWEDISSTVVLVTGLSDDNYVGPFLLNFEFPFYNNIFEEFYISSNGFISFGNGSSDLSNDPIPLAGLPNNLIAWCWDDLYPNGTVYYQEFGNRIVVQFVDYGEYGRFAFLDATAYSYPGFIITGDRVRMLEHCPVCDRPGPVLEPEVKRVKGEEVRGCAEEVRRMLSIDS